MPRQPRAIADSGIYHVMMRGCGKQIIFEDDLDRETFLRLADAKLGSNDVLVLAWCLMDNHVHFLLEDLGQSLSKAVQALGTAYARYYNGRTGHVGHLFQDRFKSRAVESDDYLLQVIAYIHNNPAEGGICKPDEYPWSSYWEYVFGHRMTSEGCLCSTSRVLSLVGGEKGFRSLPYARDLTSFRPFESKRVPDAEMLSVARDVIGSADPASLKELNASTRCKHLRALRDAGLSVRQIERITGIGTWSIRKATDFST